MQMSVTLQSLGGPSTLAYLHRDSETFRASNNFHQRELCAGKVGKMSTEEKEQPMEGISKRPCWWSGFPLCFFALSPSSSHSTPPAYRYLPILTSATGTLTVY